MRHHPSDPAYSRTVAKARAWREYRAAVAEVGPEHPRTQAAWGRVLFHEGAVPQRGRFTLCDGVALYPSPKNDPCLIGWYRESGAIQGFGNRAEREHEFGLTIRGSDQY